REALPVTERLAPVAEKLTPEQRVPEERRAREVPRSFPTRSILSQPAVAPPALAIRPRPAVESRGPVESSTTSIERRIPTGRPACSGANVLGVAVRATEAATIAFQRSPRSAVTPASSRC